MLLYDFFNVCIFAPVEKNSFADYFYNCIQLLYHNYVLSPGGVCVVICSCFPFLF